MCVQEPPISPVQPDSWWKSHWLPILQSRVCALLFPALTPNSVLHQGKDSRDQQTPGTGFLCCSPVVSVSSACKRTLCCLCSASPCDFTGPAGSSGLQTAEDTTLWGKNHFYFSVPTVAYTVNMNTKEILRGSPGTWHFSGPSVASWSLFLCIPN